MDSQMPRMGGFEATAEIRHRERDAGNGHVPIIAMTANVMKGSREECLAAGMDGYVAKPMRRLELIEEIAKVVPGFIVEADGPVSPSSPYSTMGAAASSSIPASPDGDEPFDANALLDSLDGNRAMVAEMIQLCLDVDAPRLLSNLRDGLATRDFAAIEQAAHGIKGLVGEFKAPAARIAAKELEDAGRGHESEMIPAHAHTLFAEFDRLSAALRRFAERWRE
jgi:CheY-like chemotaxis protein